MSLLSADAAQHVVARAQDLPAIPAIEDALVGTLLEGTASPVHRPEPRHESPRSSCDPPPRSIPRSSRGGRGRARERCERCERCEAASLAERLVRVRVRVRVRGTVTVQGRLRVGVQ